MVDIPEEDKSIQALSKMLNEPPPADKVAEYFDRAIELAEQVPEQWKLLAHRMMSDIHRVGINAALASEPQSPSLHEAAFYSDITSALREPKMILHRFRATYGREPTAKEQKELEEKYGVTVDLAQPSGQEEDLDT